MENPEISLLRQYAYADRPNYEGMFYIAKHTKDPLVRKYYEDLPVVKDFLKLLENEGDFGQYMVCTRNNPANVLKCNEIMRSQRYGFEFWKDLDAHLDSMGAEIQSIRPSVEAASDLSSFEVVTSIMSHIINGRNQYFKLKLHYDLESEDRRPFVIEIEMDYPFVIELSENDGSDWDLYLRLPQEEDREAYVEFYLIVLRWFIPDGNIVSEREGQVYY